MAMRNDYEKLARRLDRIANAFERIADALEVDRKDEPPMDCKGCKHWKGGCDIDFPICKRDPVEDEPLKTTEYCNYCNHKGCDNCIADGSNPYCVPSQFEPQTCEECEHWNDTEDGCADRHGYKTEPNLSEIPTSKCHYEPQTDWHYDEQDATWYPYKHEDEPQQKSCATCKHALGNWDGESNNCGRCCGADRRFYEPKYEPQTERSE